jgi:hypothetical protein
MHWTKRANSGATPEMSRLAIHLMHNILVARRIFPDNPGWTEEARIAAGYLIAGDDQGYFEFIERELFGD